MPDPEHNQSVIDDQRPTTFWRFLFRERLTLEKETAWFILVNVLDFFATYLLLGKGGHFESNPLARWFLDGWGRVKGLLAYKLAMIAFVCVIVQIIAIKQVKTARWVLIFGTLVVTGVVIYSVNLLVRAN